MIFPSAKLETPPSTTPSTAPQYHSDAYGYEHHPTRPPLYHDEPGLRTPSYPESSGKISFHKHVYYWRWLVYIYRSPRYTISSSPSWSPLPGERTGKPNWYGWCYSRQTQNHSVQFQFRKSSTAQHSWCYIIIWREKRWAKENPFF